MNELELIRQSNMPEEYMTIYTAKTYTLILVIFFYCFGPVNSYSYLAEF